MERGEKDYFKEKNFEEEILEKSYRSRKGDILWDRFLEIEFGMMPQRKEVEKIVGEPLKKALPEKIETAINFIRQTELYPQLATESKFDLESLRKQQRTLEDIERGVNIKDFLEILEPRIRDLCQKINRLSFLRTINSCLGVKREEEVGKREDYFTFLVDIKSKKGQEFLKNLAILKEESSFIKNEEIEGPRFKGLPFWKTAGIRGAMYTFVYKEDDPLYEKKFQEFTAIIEKAALEGERVEE